MSTIEEFLRKAARHDRLSARSTSGNLKLSYATVAHSLRGVAWDLSAAPMDPTSLCPSCALPMTIILRIQRAAGEGIFVFRCRPFGVSLTDTRDRNSRR
jgi:hypothetical protein